MPDKPVTGDTLHWIAKKWLSWCAQTSIGSISTINSACLTAFTAHQASACFCSDVGDYHFGCGSFALSDACWKENESGSASALTEVRTGSEMRVTLSETSVCLARGTWSGTVVRTVLSCPPAACCPPLQPQGKATYCSPLQGIYCEH